MKFLGTRNPTLLIAATALLAVGVLCLCAMATPPAPPALHVKAWAALRGRSMVPTFPDNCLIELDLGEKFADLKAGEIVVFSSWDPNAPFKCHRLVVKRGGGWVTKGDNNSFYDTEWVTASTFVAVATGRAAPVIIAGMEPPVFQASP